jgi:hypothetical protein
MNDIDGRDYTQWHAEERANFVSKITFFWLIDLFKFGHKHQITANDIVGVRRADASAKLSKTFSALWNSDASLWRAIGRVYGLRVAVCGLLFSTVDTASRCVYF